MIVLVNAKMSNENVFIGKHAVKNGAASNERGRGRGKKKNIYTTEKKNRLQLLPLCD